MRGQTWGTNVNGPVAVWFSLGVCLASSRCSNWGKSCSYTLSCEGVWGSPTTTIHIHSGTNSIMRETQEMSEPDMSNERADTYITCNEFQSRFQAFRNVVKAIQSSKSRNKVMRNKGARKSSSVRMYLGDGSYLWIYYFNSSTGGNFRLIEDVPASDIWFKFSMYKAASRGCCLCSEAGSMMVAARLSR